LSALLEFLGFPLVSDEDQSIALCHVPASDRVDRRRPEGLSGAQIETGVVPGATHGVANHKTLG
jgi:hypothetical protein